MAPRKSPKKDKQPKKGGSKRDKTSRSGKTSSKDRGSRISKAAIEDVVNVVVEGSPANTVQSSDKSVPKVVSKHPKKTSDKRLIKNPKFKKSKPLTSGVNEEAPWFSSLVKDVASVLNRVGSPLKRKRCDESVVGDKRRKGDTSSSEGSSQGSQSVDDSDFDMGDEEYYFDQFDDILDDGNSTNNANSSGLLNSQKRELLDFMDNFINAYDSKRDAPHTSKSTKGKAPNAVGESSRKSVHFPVDNTSNEFTPSVSNDGGFRYPVPFGSQFLNVDSSVGHPSKDQNFVNSLKKDRQANKVAETFLQ